MNRRQLVITIWIVCTLAIYVGATPLFADVAIVDREAWGADESLVKPQNDQYEQIDSIKIVKITPPDSVTAMSTTNWVRSLYYYFTVMQGFSDIPFNYLVGWDGKIYLTKEGKQDVQVESTEKLGTLVIGYLAEGDNDTMTPLGYASTKALVDQLTKQDSIPLYAVIASSWNVVQQNRKNVLQFVDSTNAGWNENIINMKKDLGFNPNANNQNVLGATSEELQIPHSGHITSISLSGSIMAKNIVNVSVTFTNEGKMNMYSPLGIVTKETPNNPFYTTSWKDQATAYEEYTARVEQGQSRTLQFQITVPADKSQWKQDFYITALGNKIDGTDFTIDLNNPPK